MRAIAAWTTVLFIEMEEDCRFKAIKRKGVWCSGTILDLGPRHPNFNSNQEENLQ